MNRHCPRPQVSVICHVALPAPVEPVANCSPSLNFACNWPQSLQNITCRQNFPSRVTGEAQGREMNRRKGSVLREEKGGGSLRIQLLLEARKRKFEWNKIRESHASDFVSSLVVCHFMSASASRTFVGKERKVGHTACNTSRVCKRICLLQIPCRPDYRQLRCGWWMQGCGLHKQVSRIRISGQLAPQFWGRKVSAPQSEGKKKNWKLQSSQN